MDRSNVVVLIFAVAMGLVVGMLFADSGSDDVPDEGIVQCTVTFDANGYVFDDGETSVSITVDKGAEVSCPEAPVVYSHYLTGWTEEKGTSATIPVYSYTVHKDITLYATWEAYPLYPVFTDLDVNPGDGDLLQLPELTNITGWTGSAVSISANVHDGDAEDVLKVFNSDSNKPVYYYDIPYDWESGTHLVATTAYSDFGVACTWYIAFTIPVKIINPVVAAVGINEEYDFEVDTNGVILDCFAVGIDSDGVEIRYDLVYDGTTFTFVGPLEGTYTVYVFVTSENGSPYHHIMGEYRFIVGGAT